MRLIVNDNKPEFYIPKFAWFLCGLRWRFSGHLLAAYRFRNYVNAPRLYTWLPIWDAIVLTWQTRKALNDDPDE